MSSLMLLYLENEKTGYVHSIFNNTFNVRFGENIVHFSGNKKNLVSFGCFISEAKMKLLLKSLRIGNIVIRKDKNLLFYTENKVEEIDLQKMEIKDLKIFRVKNINKVTEKIMKNIKNIDFENKIGIKNERNEIEKRLSKGLTEENQKYFTGRGQGLTPSGDDIMLGYSFINNLYGKKEPLLYGNLTTDISRQYFDALNRGYVNECFLELVRGDTEKAVRDICNIGHTSGYDTLFGMYTGIKNNLQKTV